MLEALGESVELARAYSGLSQLAMLAEDVRAGLGVGRQGSRARESIGRRAHPRARARQHRHHQAPDWIPAQSATLHEAHEVAHAAGEPYEATRALNNIAYTLMCWADAAQAMRSTRSERLTTPSNTRCTPSPRMPPTTMAWLRLRAGEWDEAERITQNEIDKNITVIQLLAQTVLAELAVRRGDADAAARLADLASHAERSGDLQRITPLIELTHRVHPHTRMNQCRPSSSTARAELSRAIGGLAGWNALRMAGWAAVAGLDIPCDGVTTPPYAAMAQARVAGRRRRLR